MKLGALPFSVIICGLPVALSVIVIAALRAPPEVGVKVTLIRQIDPAAKPLAQLFVCAKSPAFAPVTDTLEIESAAPPKLVSCVI